MNLQEQLLDLTARMHVAENDLCPQLEDAQAKLQEVNRRYNKIRGKEPNLWLRSFIVALIIPMIFAYVMQNVLYGKPSALIIGSIIATSAVGVIMNIILSKGVYAMRKKHADSWWNETGKGVALTISNAISNMRQSMYEYVAENPLLEQIPQDWWSESDCAALYKIILQRRAITLEEAFSVYSDMIEAELQREIDREERRRAIAAITERQEELQRSLDRAERDRVFTNMALDDIRFHIKYGD